jgi:ribosomal protein L11 methyltransferase
MTTTLELVLADGTDARGLEAALDAVLSLGPITADLLDGARPPRVVARLDTDDARGVRARLDAALAGAGAAVARLDLVGDDAVDWGAGATAALAAHRFGPLWVVPLGHVPPAEAAHVVHLDARGAFGSGAHASTRMILERLAELSPVERVLDVGTGTGLLALAALALGAERVVATDLDPAALAAARANAERNGLADRLELSSRAPDEHGAQFDVVVANIAPAPLMALAPRLVRALGSRGTLLLSGIPAGQADDVARVFRDVGLSRTAGDREGDWVMLELLASW